jgi:hypothetical protein
MGEYFRIVNLDKREYINPHDCGEQYGAKLGEVAMSSGGPMSALAVLVSTSEWQDHCGRWCGDRIALVGDYSELGQDPWGNEDEWTNITSEVMLSLERLGWSRTN